MAKAVTIERPFVQVKQKDLSFILTTMPAWALVDATYVSIRGVDEEEGAVQRFLNARRISSIRDFTIEVGIYPTSLVLNWNHKSGLKRNGNNVKIPIVPRGAQLIDGQHRRAGISAALRVDKSVRDYEVPVAIFENLTTAQCADIFISINTEQKPVPKSLVYDLFSSASEYIADHGVQRAADIARFLDEESESPYLQLIKFPGSRYERGGIALSTAVTALKPLVEDKGDFDQIKIVSLEQQSQILMSYCQQLAEPYGDQWLTAKNAFIYAAGFTGAIEFFRKRVLPYCVKKKSFKPAVIAECIGLTSDNLILQDELKGRGGKNSVSHVYDRLNEAFDIGGEEGHGFEI